MMKLNVERIKSDGRRKEHGFWHRWMEEAAIQATRFYEDGGGDDPFAYGETASVGFLASMAARCGYLALPEFAVTKKGALDKRRRSRGRADLWIRASEERDWWFEFKQHFIARGSLRDLKRKWEAAERCAVQVGNNGVSVAALVVTFSWLKMQSPQNLEAAREVLKLFCEDKQFVWSIKSGEDDGPETYLIFDIIREIGVR